MTHPNAELIRGGYDAFAEGDVPAVMERLADDIVWHIGGRSLLAGEYHGHDGVTEFFGKLMDMSGGTFKLAVHDVAATDRHVFVIVDIDAERDGKPYKANAVHVWHIADGKAEQFRAISVDAYADDEFWS